MPELPDIEVYVRCLRPRVVGSVIERVRVVSPFVLRSVEPPVEAVEGAMVRGVTRLGKRVVIECVRTQAGERPPLGPLPEGGETDVRGGETDVRGGETDVRGGQTEPGGVDTASGTGTDALFLVIHLMIAGRLLWADDARSRGPGRITLVTLHTPRGTLVLTEAGSKKRAGLWVVRGASALWATHGRAGLDLLDDGLTAGALAARLRSENRTLKRALTSPALVDGVGNAYSDEILHAARLSPFVLTGTLTDAQCAGLLSAARAVLTRSRDLLLRRFAARFPGPGDITAFRPEFAAHGKFGKPCPVCGAKIQRIVYAENECNYCPKCQTGGRVLADRSLSRLLKEDWPRTVEEWEEKG